MKISNKQRKEIEFYELWKKLPKQSDEAIIEFYSIVSGGSGISHGKFIKEGILSKHLLESKRSFEVMSKQFRTCGMAEFLPADVEEFDEEFKSSTYYMDHVRPLFMQYAHKSITAFYGAYPTLI